MTEKLDQRPDIKPGPQGGDVDLIAFCGRWGLTRAKRKGKPWRLIIDF